MNLKSKIKASNNQKKYVIIEPQILRLKMTVFHHAISHIKHAFLSNQPLYYTNKTNIKFWLDKMGIKNYVIHDNLVVDVNDDVNLSRKKIKHIPIQFGLIKGFFDCSYNKLTSLKGIAQEIEGNVNCSHNKLTSLQYCPSVIQGDFNCSYNQLLSLNGIAQEVYGALIANNNQLTNFYHLPKIKSDMNFKANPINNLEGLPKTINNNFYIDLNLIAQLKEDFIFKDLFLYNEDEKNYVLSNLPNTQFIHLYGKVNFDTQKIKTLGNVQILNHMACQKSFFIKEFSSLYIYSYNLKENKDYYLLSLNPEKLKQHFINKQLSQKRKKNKRESIKKMLTSESQIKDWLLEMGIKHYKIHENLIVDVNEDVDLNLKQLKIIPIQFGKIMGNFDISRNNLKSLKGSPHTVLGHFDCQGNSLKNLDFAPKIVKDTMNCSSNRIKSLKNCPQAQKLECNRNRLTSLEYAPIDLVYLYCGYNELTSLQHCPPNLNELNIRNNKLSSLKGIAQKLHSLTCNDNQLTSLEFCPSNLKALYCSNNQITSLKGVPLELNECDISSNKLTSLEYSPKKVSIFKCWHNQLTSLEFAPDMCDYFFCNDNKLTSLKGLENSTIFNYLNCSNNQLTTLEYSPSMIKTYMCHNNKITTFKHIITNNSLNVLECDFDWLIDFKNIPTVLNGLTIHINKKFQCLENIHLKAHQIDFCNSKVHFGKNVYLDCFKLKHIKNESNYFIKGLHSFYNKFNDNPYHLEIKGEEFNTLFNANFEKNYLEKLTAENDTHQPVKTKRKKI